MSELDDLHAALSSAAAANPAVVLVAMLDEIVDTLCGSNPALKGVLRVQFYRRLVARLTNQGVPGWK